jgi:hypothetical protein
VVFYPPPTILPKRGRSNFTFELFSRACARDIVKKAKEFPWLAGSFAIGLKKWLLLEAFLYSPYHLSLKASTSRKSN